MLAPRCESCGGLLESLPLVAGVDRDVAVLGGPPPRHLSPAFGRMLRFALFALLLFAGARYGWSAGGPDLGMAGIGVVGLFTAPLIVEE
jgi:hypothetical protein